MTDPVLEMSLVAARENGSVQKYREGNYRVRRKRVTGTARRKGSRSRL